MPARTELTQPVDDLPIGVAHLYDRAFEPQRRNFADDPRVVFGAAARQEVQVEGQAHDTAIVAFDPTGQLLAWGDESPRLIDSNTGGTIRELDGHRAWLFDARFSSAGRRAVTASQDGTARVWDVSSGRSKDCMLR